MIYELVAFVNYLFVQLLAKQKAAQMRGLITPYAQVVEMRSNRGYVLNKLYLLLRIRRLSVRG